MQAIDAIRAIKKYTRSIDDQIERSIELTRSIARSRQFVVRRDRIATRSEEIDLNAEETLSHLKAIANFEKAASLALALVRHHARARDGIGSVAIDRIAIDHIVTASRARRAGEMNIRLRDYAKSL